MRCRIHSSDAGSGVCACCLRDRLSALTFSPVDGDLQNPDSSTSPSSFPNFSDRRSTDQGSGGRKSCSVKFSILNPLWGSKNTPKKVEINAVVLKPSGSNVRLSALILPQRIRRNNKSTAIRPAAEDEIRGRSKKPPGSGRGMSPASGNEGAPAPSPLKRKVVATQPHNAQTQPSSRSVSSFAMCLNPVVRPSHGYRRSHGLGQAVVAGEIRRTIVRGYDGGAAVPDPSFVLGPNRSRKLVDLGKIWG